VFCRFGQALREGYAPVTNCTRRSAYSVSTSFGCYRLKRGQPDLLEAFLVRRYNMSNEAEIGSPGAPEGGGHPQGGGGVCSPLQTRAAFVKNWDWQSIVSINRGACKRSGAQHGFNSETGSACAQEWEALREESLSLGETLDRLRSFHKKAPFLFFNGNTFATIGRELSFALFSDLSSLSKREIGSAVAHYIAGVLDRESMVEIVDGLWQAQNLKVGDRVKTLRSSAHGIIVRLLPDGGVVWRPDGSDAELRARPESLLRV